jgi:uncharacterized transporter YbjL
MEPDELAKILCDAGAPPSDARTGYSLVALGLTVLASSGESTSRMQAEVVRMMRDLRVAVLAARGRKAGTN